MSNWLSIGVTLLSSAGSIVSFNLKVVHMIEKGVWTVYSETISGGCWEILSLVWLACSLLRVIGGWSISLCRKTVLSTLDIYGSVFDPDEPGNECCNGVLGSDCLDCLVLACSLHRSDWISMAPIYVLGALEEGMGRCSEYGCYFGCLTEIIEVYINIVVSIHTDKGCYSTMVQYVCIHVWNKWIVCTLWGSVHSSKLYLLSGVITQARPWVEQP